jgi:hypothetical protein
MPRAVAQRERPIVVNVGTEAAAPTEQAPAPKPEPKLDVWSYMAQLTPKEWESHIVYLTREEPKVSINGSGGYLRKFVQAFDMDDIKRTYGGYRFSYIMKRDNQLIYSGDFKVEAPPLYDRERENVPGAAPATRADSNGDLLKEFVSVLRDELARSREANGNSSSADAAIDMVSKASERAMEIVKSQVPAGTDPSDQLGKLVGTLKNLGLFPQPAAAAGNSLLETITVLERIGVFQKPKTMLEQIAELNALKEFMGGEGGGGKTTWLDLGREALPKVLDAISAAAANQAQVQQRPRPVPPQPAARVPAPGQQPAPPQRAIPAAAPSSSGLRMVPVDENGEAPPPAGGQPINVAAEEPFSVVMRKKIVETVHFGDDAENDATDIVNFLQIAWPEGARYLETLSEEQITNFFAMDPILVVATQEPRWREVLTFAKAYAIELLADAGPEPPTPPARKPN